MSEEKKQEAAVVEPGDDKSKGSFKGWDEMVEYFKTNIEGISKSTLRVCWEMGYETNLIKEAAVYGEKTIENFAEQLELPDMNVKRLYRYAQFAKEYSRKELDSAMDKNISVGVLSINLSRLKIKRIVLISKIRSPRKVSDLQNWNRNSVSI